jgi:site-specific DNA-methyltransferase (adenine-specific)
MIDNQKGRRNITDGWKFELAQLKKGMLAEKGRERISETQKARHSGVSLSTIDKDAHDTRSEIATDLGWSTGKVAMADKVWKSAPEEVKNKVKSGDVSINQAYQQIRHKEKLDKREAKQSETAKAIVETTQSAKRDITSVCEIRHCSCAELFASGIIPDAVITDPPYPKEFLPTFTELAESCAKAGVKVIAVMSGQSYLPEVYERMSAHLKYRWTLAYLTPGGQAVQQWQAKVNTFWKPILLFGDAEDWFGDVAKSESNDNDKRFHKWGQSVSGMADLVERLTKPGSLICDPFCGGGATAIAAVMSGRRFIGCDIDESKVTESKTRLENAILED